MTTGETLGSGTCQSVLNAAHSISHTRWHDMRVTAGTRGKQSRWCNLYSSIRTSYRWWSSMAVSCYRRHICKGPATIIGHGLADCPQQHGGPIHTGRKTQFITLTLLHWWSRWSCTWGVAGKLRIDTCVPQASCG